MFYWCQNVGKYKNLKTCRLDLWLCTTLENIEFKGTGPVGLTGQHKLQGSNFVLLIVFSSVFSATKLESG